MGVVAVGIDSHKSSLAAAAVDELGRVVNQREFDNTRSGHRALLRWIGGFGAATIGIEGSQSYGAALSSLLLEQGRDVREVPPGLAIRQRRRRPAQGKSDPRDAVAIARAVAQGEGLSSAARDGGFVDLKLLVDHRDHLICTRTKLSNQVHQDLVVLVPGYEKRIANLTTKKNLSAAMTVIRGNRSVRADLVRERIAEIRRLDEATKRVTTRIQDLVAATSTSLLEIPGVGPIVAAKILGEVGDPRRIRSRGAFARLAGTAPIEASSGATSRHRFDRGGNRQLNRCLHVIAFNQARRSELARAYLERKRSEGKSSKEAMRCLKRQLSNVVFRALEADAVRLETARFDT